MARKDVSAVEVARSLMSGAFQGPGERVESPEPKAEASDSGESGTGKLSDSFTLSSSSVALPGSSSATHGKSRTLTYWQSVARIGVQVAESLEYAHKQGVQHRDIKPSNLLLDTRGTVWVTDFGLARADNEDHLTQTGDIVGTLRYIPPEAFEGRADKHGDIYSLGLTLYELLARQPAFEDRDRHRLIKRVTTEEPPRLDKLNRAIPRDLVTIVHKAIDREPARRYATAGALAADLQRFLDDEPIQARRISNHERFARWCRHYPGVATLTATLALILLAVTVAALVAAARFDGLARKQAATAEDERQARREAELAKEHEAGLRKQAEEARKQADEQKQRAESNFAKARQAVDDYFTKVSESQLLRVPGTQPLRRELLQSALIFYQDFLNERGGDPALGGDLAAAYLRVGKIHAALGKEGEARQAWDQARRLYEALTTKAAPTSIAWRHGLAQCYFHLGRHDDAIALWEKLVQPGQTRFRKELAKAYTNRATRFTYTNRHAQALQDYQQGLAIRDMLARLHPDDPDVRRDLGESLLGIGDLLALMGRSAEALAMYRRAADNAEVAFAKAPEVLLNGRFLASAQRSIAELERRRFGHVKEALAAYQRIVEVCRKLARDNPAVPSLHSSLFAAYRTLASYQHELKQTASYEQTMRQARAVIDRLPVDGAGPLFNLACVRAECSAILARKKDQRTAEEQAEQQREEQLAVEALRKAIAAGFRNMGLLRTTSALDTLRGRDDFKALEANLAAGMAAAPAYKLKAGEQALALRQKLAQADPTNKRLRADLAASRHALALIQLDRGNVAEARKHLQQAITLRDALVKDEPTNEQHQTDLAWSRLALGDVYWKCGRWKEGENYRRQELASLVERLRDKNNALAKGRLAAIHQRIGDDYARIGLWDEAAVALESAFKLQPDPPHYLTWIGRAALALQRGNPDHFRRVCRDFAGLSPRFDHSHILTRLNMLGSGAYPDPAIAVTAAEQVLAGPSHYGLGHWYQFMLGTAHYRAGHYVKAERHIRESMAPAPGLRFLSHRWFWLAMVCQRQGKAEEAKQWLNKGVQWLEHGRVEQPPEGGRENASWDQALELRLLRREAEMLILGKASPEPMNLVLERAGAYVRLGQSKKAETIFQAALSTWPKEPAVWLARGLAFAELGRHDKAGADVARAVELVDDKARELVWMAEASASEVDQRFARLAADVLLKKLTAALERNPEDMDQRRQRGEWYARQRRWKEAAADFRLVLERNPPGQEWLPLHAAPVLVAAGDPEGHRRLCRKMLERFGETHNPFQAERIAKVCLLLPASAKDTDQACQLADRAFRRGKDDPARPRFVFCKGLADYRRGNVRAAIAVLHPLVPETASTPDLTTDCHLVLAMALHRQGDRIAARAHLTRAAKLLDQYARGPSHFPSFANSRLGYNHDWLIGLLLHREARMLIEAETSKPKK